MGGSIHSDGAADVTLGILAGGRGTRLGGLDKAWLERAGVAQVLRIAERFAPEVGSLLVSANRNLSRYQQHGIRVVADVLSDAGPIAGLDALSRACSTSWLLTLPVDLVDLDACLLRRLTCVAGANGAHAVDEDGVQPLVALWRVAAMRDGLARATASGDFSVQALQRRLGLTAACIPGVRFGNLNTPADLAAAGIQHSA